MQRRKQRTEGAPVLAFSIDSFADSHQIGRSTVFEEIKSGRLKARKVNGRTIITHEDATSWRNSLPLAGSAA